MSATISPAANLYLHRASVVLTGDRKVPFLLQLPSAVALAVPVLSSCGRGPGRTARRALELAWEAFCSGTVPVGAVVSTDDGQLLFEGRNRMYEQVAPAGELGNSLLAHAEVNALGRLNPEERHEHLTLTATLEPCPLCLGAVHMATIGRLVFLGSDPYGGAVGLLASTPHTARVPLAVEGPRPDALGSLASALHVAFYLGRNPSGRVVRTHERLAPGLFAAGREVYELTRQWTSPRPLAEVLPALLDAVAPHAPLAAKSE